MEVEREKENKFFEACHYGDIELIESCIYHGININAQHYMNGWSGLQWACKNSQTKVVQLLLSKGANPMLENFEGENANEIAKNEDTLKILASYRSNGACDELSIESDSKSNPLKYDDISSPFPEKTRDLPPKITKDTFSSSNVTPVQNGLQFSSLQDSSTSPIKQSYTSSGSNSSDLPSKRNVDASKDFTVKIRIAHITDTDFIEIDLPTCDLTYGQLLLQCCKELSVNPQAVERIRKLPNTRLRQDKDVRRLKNLEELELVVKGISYQDVQCNGSQNKKSYSKNEYKSISNFNNQTILY